MLVEALIEFDAGIRDLISDHWYRFEEELSLVSILSCDR